MNVSVCFVELVERTGAQAHLPREDAVIDNRSIQDNSCILDRVFGRSRYGIGKEWQRKKRYTVNGMEMKE